MKNEMKKTEKDIEKLKQEKEELKVEMNRMRIEKSRLYLVGYCNFDCPKILDLLAFQKCHKHGLFDGICLFDSDLVS